MNHKIHNRNVRSRYKNIRLRRNSELIIREQRQEFLSFVEIADSLIGFGNEFIMDSWHEDFNIKTFPFNNYGFKSTQFLTKNFTTARKNFFFLASGSQVLKGLDLLLEIFPKHPKLNLYICSSFNNEPDFIKCYYKELYRTSNIHPIGWISITSPKFLELVKQCAYVISPSCVEGQPGAVVQCMHAGLIPVVTKETGIETEDFGVTFKNDSLEELETTITRLSKLPITWHKNHSQLTRKIALEKYSEKSFINRWREILSEIKYTVEK
jgi:glycosyltransferase involved in cell wall biosynthesis